MRGIEETICPISQSQEDPPRIFATEPEFPEQDEPSEAFDAPAARNDDDLVIEDPTLTAAAAECAHGRRRQTMSASFIVALVLAIMIHGAVAAVLCLLLANVILRHAPRVEFAQGAVSAQSGLISDRPAPADPQLTGIPGPTYVASPSAAAPLSRIAPPDDSPIDPIPKTAASLTKAAPASSADSTLIGLAENPAAAAPRWHDARPAPHGEPTPAGTGAAASAPRAVAAVAHHFVPPHGAGHGGRGDQGTGLDSRGIPVPQYPPESRRRHEEGTVDIEVRIEPDGSVGAARFVKTSGFARLDNAALAAIRVARFTPATEDGRPVTARVVMPFRFEFQ